MKTNQTEIIHPTCSECNGELIMSAVDIHCTECQHIEQDSIEETLED